MIDKKYSLVKEHDKHFEIHDSSDNKKFNVAKKDLHPARQIQLMKMQKFSDGGVTDLPDKFITAEEAGQPKGKEDSFSLGKFLGKAVTNPVGAVGLDKPLNAVAQGAWDNVYGPIANTVGGVAKDVLGGGLEQVGITPPAPGQGMINPQIQSSGLQPTPDIPQGTQPQVPVAGAQGTPGSVSPGQIGGLLKQQEQGINQEAQGLQEQENAKQNIYNNFLTNSQAKDQQFNTNMQKLQEEHDTLFNDIATKKIDPHKFWANKSTGSKIATILGVLLGGIGSGLTGKDNIALKMLEDQTNKDIDAQKEEMGKKQNLLGDNLRKMGNLRDAENMTRLQMNTNLQAQLSQMAAQTNSPLIQARAQQQIAQLKLGAIPLQQSVAQAQTQMQFKQIAMNAANQGGGQVDPAVLVQHLVPEHHQQKVFDEIEAAQNTSKNAPAILDSFDKAAKNIHVADFVPGAQNADQKSLHALLGPTFKDVEGTVRQAAMDNMFSNITPQFGDNENTTKTKRAALSHYLSYKQSAPTAKGYGIDLGKFNSTRYADPMAFKGREGKPVK